MSKKPTRFLFILIAVAMIFGMLASSQSATANNPSPDRQVLVVPFEDRDSLKFLADH